VVSQNFHHCACVCAVVVGRGGLGGEFESEIFFATSSFFLDGLTDLRKK
jgi:hypothetical protein